MATNLLLGGEKEILLSLEMIYMKKGGVVGGEGGYYMVKKIF